MTLRRFRAPGLALALIAFMGTVTLLPAGAQVPTPAEMQQQMQDMRIQMMAMQGQMQQMDQLMQRMMGQRSMDSEMMSQGMMSHGMMNQGMMGSGTSPRMMDPGMMGCPMMGAGMMGAGMMGSGMGPGMMGQGMGSGMMGQPMPAVGMMGALDADPDRNFVLAMVRHHENAIAMATAMAAETKDAEIKKLADAIQESAKTELTELEAWLEKRP